MAELFYIRLIALTAGTLVYLFLLALILGHRRPRRFERLLFFLVLAGFLIYAGGLLAINAVVQYGTPSAATQFLCTMLIGAGALMLLPLIFHAHVEYSRTVQKTKIGGATRGGVWLLYLVAVGEAAGAAAILRARGGSLGAELLNFSSLGLLADLAMCAAVAAGVQFALLRRETNRSARILGRWLFAVSCLLLVILVARVADVTVSPFLSDLLVTTAIAAGVLPGALLIYFALRHNFLDFGAQRNLVYALSASFLALLYLALVRRVSGWLEPALPAEATASILLFLLVFLFEPLERVIGPALHRTLRERMAGVQRLAVELQECARRGSAPELVALAERRIREEFGLAAVRVTAPLDRALAPLASPGGLGHVTRLPLLKDGEEIGLLEASTTGSYLTGETLAGLELLAEQFPAMLDVARLIEEKLRLERELAERERLALLGQMAASVSHNLRNPLSSMKTILQVQLENPDLPLDVRHDCALVVEEIDRMSAKLKQLLNFAKPAIHDRRAGQRVAAVALARQTAALFGRDAERRGVRMEFSQPAEEIFVVASEEALSEVLSNLIVNAIEAQAGGGRVRVSLALEGGHAQIAVEDDGPGIGPELRARIFEPYFTTKATGTGLGLSIVARRVSEMGGEMECESPARDGRGARFRVTLPAADEAAGASANERRKTGSE
ncbi:MAG: ATP-binding protein [Candidatus Acidiferrales bacterium]